MKLTYWVMNCEDDSTRYNIRAKTRKAVLTEMHLQYKDEFKRVVRKLSDMKFPDGRLAFESGAYSDPVKVIINYDNAFDLIEKTSGEDYDYYESSLTNSTETKFVWIRK